MIERKSKKRVEARSEETGPSPIAQQIAAGSGVRTYESRRAVEDERRRAMDHGEMVVQVPLEKIVPGSYQSRIVFEKDDLQALADDIRENGVTSPVLVRPTKDPETGEERYELAFGERRWQASRLAGKTTIPARIQNLDDLQMHLIAAGENNKRADFSAYERAQEVHRIELHIKQVQGKVTQHELARIFSRNPGTINEQLKIASMITEDVLAKADLSKNDVCELPHSTLIRVAKLPYHEIPRKLTEALRHHRRQKRKDAPGSEPRGREGDGVTSQSLAQSRERWTKWWERGGFQINVRRPLKDLPPGKANKYIRDLLPGVVGLAQRATNGQGPVHHWEHDEGHLIFLGRTESMNAEEKQAARARLERMIEDLGA